MTKQRYSRQFPDFTMESQFTAKQILFIQSYVDLGDHIKAAEIAGYSNPSNAGWELLNKDKYAHVKAEIDRRIAATQDQAIDEDWVLDELIKVLEVAKAHVSPQTNSRTGTPTRDQNDRPIFKRDNKLITEVLKLIGNHKNVKAWDNTTVVEHREDETINRLMEAQKDRYRKEIH
jgi:phage terminase small subunit